VDTRSYFDDIKLAEDFMEQGQHLQFPVSTLEGDFIAIKHGIQIQRHNIPAEWATPEPYKGPLSYYPMKGGGGVAINFHLASHRGTQPRWGHLGPLPPV
jgi:hypothetical protein